jgi:hypothetical protein
MEVPAKVFSRTEGLGLLGQKLPRLSPVGFLRYVFLVGIIGAMS